MNTITRENQLARRRFLAGGLAAGQQHGDALFLHFFSSSFDACFFFLGLG